MRHEHADSLAGVTRIAAFIFRPQMKPETTVISAPGGLGKEDCHKFKDSLGYRRKLRN